MDDQTDGYIQVIKKQGEFQRANQSAVKSYAPGELEFRAEINGVKVNSGDYWLPDKSGSCYNCYKVKVSSRGIHYTRKCKDPQYLTDWTGSCYYRNWESEEVYFKDVKLYLISEATPTE